MLSAKLRLNPSIKHLLISSKVSSDFWNHVLSWLRDKSTIVGNVKEDISFGKCDVKKDDFLLINQIFLLGKYHFMIFIHKKCPKGMPSLQGFSTRTRRIYIAARKRGTSSKHFWKWEKLINFMSIL